MRRPWQVCLLARIRGASLGTGRPGLFQPWAGSGEQAGCRVPVRMARPPWQLGGRNGCPSRLLTPLSLRAGAQAPCRVHPQSAPFRTRARHKDPSMSNLLVINASGQETRVALIEQGTIAEYYLERKNEKGIVGNIYKGKVVRVLPGMQAAFVDIGLDKAAFLYVGDIVSDPSFPGFSEEMDIKAGSVEGDPLEAEDLPEPSEDSVPPPADTPSPPAPAEAGAAGETSIESAAAVTPAEPQRPAEARAEEPVSAEVV